MLKNLEYASTRAGASRPDAIALRHEAWLRAIARILAAMAGGLSLLCLLGWWTGWLPLARLGSGGAAMTPATALLSLLCALWLAAQLGSTPFARRSGALLSGATLLLAALTVAEHGFRMDLGIDRMLIGGAVDWGLLRPAPQPAWGFALLSTALLASRRGGRFHHARWAEVAALAAASVALVGVLCVVFGGARTLPSGVPLAGMLSLLALAGAAMAAHPAGPAMSVLAGQGPGTRTGRKLLFWLPAVPLLGVALQAGVARGWLAGSTALAVGVFIALAGMAAAIVAGADRLNAAVLRRRSELEQLRLSAAVFNSTQEAILVTDAHANIVTVNRAYEIITGYHAAEAVGKNPKFQGSGRQDAAFYRDMWSKLAQDGAWQGEIWNRRRSGEIYAVWQSISAVRDEAGRTIHYVSLFSDITAIKQAEERLRHLAHHDPLTHLPNRLLFSSTLEQAIARSARHDRRFALMSIDLDRFKAVNDTWGHPAGDRLLETVAQRLRDNVRGQDTVARLGGDEFMVLVEEIGRRDEVAHLAGKLLGVLGEPLALDGHTIHPSSSIGIAIFPEDARTSADLTRAADAALYRAKANGRSAYSFYSEELTRLSSERLAVETSLQRALDASQLRLHYQPQFALKDGGLVGFEALLRWQHPEEGLLLPDRFISVAEESSLIQRLNAWVIDEACRQGRVWLDLGLRPRRIAVNLSGRQCLNEQLTEHIARALRQQPLSTPGGGAWQLGVEVAETVLRASDQGAGVLQSLHGMGVAVAIDDFGTGCSSLSLLRQLPIDTLKLDELFVRGLPEEADNLAIVRAVVSMAHSLGLPVLAKGVETGTERDCLQALDCDQLQGHFTGRPMAAEAATVWLHRQAQAPF